MSSSLQSLSPETLAELQRLVARLEDQDNDCTRDPIFEVREKRLQWSYGMAPGDCEEKVWIEEGCGEPEQDPEEIARLEAHYAKYDEEPEGWKCYGAWWERHHIQSFLTREGAERFVAKRGYHYSNPYISTESAYRNPELLAIQALLVALTPDLSAMASAATPSTPAWTTQAAGLSDDELTEQLRADPVMRRRLEGAVTRANEVPQIENGGPYYIACFKGREIGYQLWWCSNNAGYTNDLEQAGVYPTFQPGYHDTEDTVPVPVSFVKANGGRVRQMIDIADSGNQCFHSARALREALSSFLSVAEHKDPA